MLRIGFLALLAGAVAVYPSSLTDDSVVSLRVRLGVTDTEPRAWDGTVAVTGGELLNLGLWHRRPEAKIIGADGFSLSTVAGPNFRVPPPKPLQPLTGPERFMVVPGLILDVKAHSGTVVHLKTANGDFAIEVSRVRGGEDLHLLDGAVIVDLVPVAEKLSTPEYENEQAAILTGPEGEIWVAWVAWREADNANHVLARRYDGRTWGPARRITERPSDAFLIKLGRDREGNLWAVWSDQVKGNRDLYARRFDGQAWSAVERLTEAPQPDIYHDMATDSEGNLWLVWQGFRNGASDVVARVHDGSRWSAEQRVSTSPANDWGPAIAADGNGAVYIAWDTYDKGNYDVVMRRHAGGQWSEVAPIAGTPKFESHVSIACDKQGRLWAAWNESGTLWGKDTGYALYVQGTSLYAWRAMQVAVRGSDGWQEPVAELDASLPKGLKGYNDFPKLQVDDDGRVWVFFRHRTLKVRDVYRNHEAHRATWEIYGTAFDGTGWSRPVNVPFSLGRMDMRGGFTSDGAGSLYAAWPTDDRDFDAFVHEHADVWVGRIPKPPARVAQAKLKARVEPEIRVYPIHPNEAEDILRIRNYRIESGGRTYRIYRGDTHRHTEFSMDGHNDSSLLETYRYAIDAVALDYLAVTDHNFIGGPEIPYINFILQQAVDSYFLPGAFTTLFGYERSVRYPNGHRNILFASRGNPTLKISKDEYGGRNFPYASDRTMAWSANPRPVGTKDLYAYLKKYDGIAISHSPATGMGTDWRDNDPEVEPLVEIYQGDRVSAEYEGAPRSAYTDYPRSAPGGLRPKGMVWNAWAKGYKLGVQASSDHLSTHISYACTIAEDSTREGLLEAMRKRHSYAATDNIILDYRLQAGGAEYLQGDIVKAPGDFKLRVNVIGTAPIRQIDIIKNQSFIHNRQHLPQEVAFTFQDTQPTPGESFYYVRVQQVDGQIAWSSPIWVTVR